MFVTQLNGIHWIMFVCSHQRCFICSCSTRYRFTTFFFSFSALKSDENEQKKRKNLRLKLRKNGNEEEKKKKINYVRMVTQRKRRQRHEVKCDFLRFVESVYLTLSSFLSSRSLNGEFFQNVFSFVTKEEIEDDSIEWIRNKSLQFKEIEKRLECFDDFFSLLFVCQKVAIRSQKLR